MEYPKKLFFQNRGFLVDEKVYEPAEDTFLLAENMRVKETDNVLDMGTGCGILAVLAAAKATKVVAVDVNPYAIKCAKKNAELNGVENKIDFRLGNLFQTVGFSETFDLIIFNAPYLPSTPREERSWIGKAWAGGPSGRKVIDGFVKDAPKFLATRGRILLVQSSLSDIGKTLEMFAEAGLKARVDPWVKVSFERIVLIEASRENSETEVCAHSMDAHIDFGYMTRSERTPILIQTIRLLGENMHSRENSPKRGYLSELRDWVRYVISEAEKGNDAKKKEEFLRLLKDLDEG